MRRSGGENALPNKMTSAQSDIPPEAKSGVISMHDFLDFLKLTCQVNESLDSRNADKELDYNLLAKNELVNSLLVKGAQTTSPSSSFEGGASGGALAKGLIRILLIKVFFYKISSFKTKAL